MQSALLPLLTFLAVAMSMAGVLSLLSDVYSRDKKRVQDRLDVEFQNKQREKVKRSLLFKEADSYQAELMEGARASQLTWSEWLQSMLDQSGLEMTQKQVLAYTGGTAAVGGLLLGLPMHSLLFGAVGAAAGAVCPISYVHIIRNARLEKLRQQLSDAFDLMARVLRAGQSMPQAMLAVATEFASPIAEEFAYCSEQQNLGLATEISMRDLAKRTGLVEMNIFVVAVLVQRQVGGNLSEILEKLALVVRQRYKTRGTIKTLTAEGRMQAGVLMALPPLLLVAMLVVNYDYAIVLIEKPFLIGGMAFFMALGGLWIRKIVNFDF
jgi:tight adherence protein B